MATEMGDGVRDPRARAGAAARFAAGRIGHLATVSASGQPHVVPCCFVLSGETVYTAVDGKPKVTTALRRLRNIAEHAAVSMVVDHYDEDWSALWWVRVDGRAAVLGRGAASEGALGLLARKYHQYRRVPLLGPVIAIEVQRWRWWP